MAVNNDLLIPNKQKNDSNPRSLKEKHNPIVNYIYPKNMKSIAEKQLLLEKRYKKSEKFRHYYDEIEHILYNFKSIDISTYENSIDIDLKNGKIMPDNTLHEFVNALALHMLKINQKYSRNSVFVQLKYLVNIDEDEESNDNDNDNENKNKNYVAEADCNLAIDDIALANFLYNHLYKNRLLKSELDSEKNNPYYLFDDERKTWKMKIGKSIIREQIVNYANTIARSLGFNTKAKGYSEKRIMEEVLNKIQTISDREKDMLEKFSQSFPHWVQFNDLIYDLKEHKVAKAQPFFKLKHYHSYRIPTGLSDEEINQLPIDNSLNNTTFDNDLHEDILIENNDLTNKINALFVDCKISKDAVKNNSNIIIQRMQENFKTDDIEFILTAIGNLFYHSNDWVMTLFIQGNAGIGKSQIFNFVADKLTEEKNTSTLKQKQFDGDSRFTETGILGKEFNLIGELRGKTLSKAMIEMIKSTLSDGTTYEQKGGDMRSEKFYSKIIAIGNKGQLPSIPTDDASDDGLRRRLVLIECLNETKTKNFQEVYPMHILNAVKQDFALLCMMTFNYHYQNGDINTFQRNAGCTIKPIQNFTTKHIVDTTKDYFKSHDRYRKFFCQLPSYFREAMQNQNIYDGIANDEELFKRWLYDLKSSQVKDMFMEWYQSEFPKTNMTKEKFDNHLKNVYDIEQQKPYRCLRNPSKVVRGYGNLFVDLVVSVCKEDDPNNYFQEQ